MVVYVHGWNTWSHSAVWWNTTRFHIVMYDGNMAGTPGLAVCMTVRLVIHQVSRPLSTGSHSSWCMAGTLGLTVSVHG